MTLKTIQKLLKLGPILTGHCNPKETGWQAVSIIDAQLLLVNCDPFTNHNHNFQAGLEGEPSKLCGFGPTKEKAIFNYFKKRNKT